MPRDFNRTDRISEQMQRELAIIFQREMKDPRVGMVTVNGVKISRDLSFANVYISFLNLDKDNDPIEMLDVLKQASGFIRSKLADHMRMRAIPQLRFHHDSTIEDGRHLSDLIDKAISKDNRNTDNPYGGNNDET